MKICVFTPLLAAVLLATASVQVFAVQYTATLLEGGTLTGFSYGISNTNIVLGDSQDLNDGNGGEFLWSSQTGVTTVSTNTLSVWQSY